LSISILQVQNSHHWCEFHNHMPWNKLARLAIVVRPAGRAHVDVKLEA
jgi:hypothetical protein